MSNFWKWQKVWDKANAKCKEAYNAWANADGFALDKWSVYDRWFKVRQYVFERQLASKYLGR